MLAFNPGWGGQDVIQDSAPADGLAIAFLPSIASDVLGAVPQLEAEASASSFMREQFRQTAENMLDAGLIYSSSV